MEANDDDSCRVVYYCPKSDADICELFQASQPPVITSGDRASRPALFNVYQNVRKLLDEDVGNFETVFVSSDYEQCLSQMDVFASTNPTAVLAEFVESDAEDSAADAVQFLQKLAAGVRSKRYARQVMAFVLLATHASADPARFLDASFESTYLEAGALDIMRSPLCAEAVHQLTGHIKETTRAPAKALASDMARGLVRHITDNTRPQVASHRPDENLSAQRRKAVEDAVAHWNFPAHDFDMDELAYAAMIMLENVLQNTGLEPYRLARPQLMTFVLAARREYKHEREVHYHNWRHAVDVTQSLYVFLSQIHLCAGTTQVVPQSKEDMEANAVEQLLTPTEALILIVSAIGHDVAHPGVNNAFLVASSHQLAQVYNDKSVLENYHCAAYSQLLRRHWPQLNGIPQFRSNMISIILATDMQRHFEYMGYLSDLKQKMETSDSALTDWSEKDKSHAKELAMALLLKAADISNVARPFEVSAQWAKILMHEFARQGELESELQIPTCLFGGPPDENDLLAAAQSQKGFMNLFGFPLFKGISEVMPNVSCTLSELEHNKEVWEKRIVEETARREAGGDNRRPSKTLGSVTDSQVEEARMRRRVESEPAAVPIDVLQATTSPVRRQLPVDAGHLGSPTRHLASEQRQPHSLPPSMAEEKRSSTPVLWPSAIQLVPTTGGSRRSSKDVALNHMHELSAYAQQNLAPAGSRRGSADAGWQLHQNYPGSRRGSKEESLTTILVTSQGSPATRSSPSSSQTRLGKASSPARGSGLIHCTSLKRSTSQHNSTATSYATAPSRPQHTASGGPILAETRPPSTQASSLVLDDSFQPGTQHCSCTSAPAATEMLNNLDGTVIHHSSAPAILPAPETSATVVPAKKSDSSPVISRVASGGSSLSSRFDSHTSEPRIRESRSRSRLRGLKFWKRRRGGDVAGGVDGSGQTSSADHSPQ